MPKGDIDLPREGRRRDPRLPKRLSVAEGMEALQMDLDPRPDWLRKAFGGETRAERQTRWQKARAQTRGRR